MKFISILLITGCFLTADLSAQMEDNFNLEDHQWNNRVLLIFSPNSIYTGLTRTMEMVQNNQDGFNERDLKVFQVLGSIGNSSGESVLQRDDAHTMRDRFEVGQNEFQVILIGKDGTEKMRSEEAISSEYLFEEIDAMPMRRLEMKEDG
ncbi:MAG TPA: DUF4174 domain-containing protein [Gracilimonas sp.]|nr:DUF4174 domain-containing protein [Gracilimonas sp.]